MRFYPSVYLSKEKKTEQNTVLQVFDYSRPEKKELIKKPYLWTSYIMNPTHPST